jgi:osmotically-inducible protein OsmY
MKGTRGRETWLYLGLTVTIILLSPAMMGFKGDFLEATKKMTDLQIQIASQKRLDMDSRLEDPRKITVKSVNHVVTLGGTVSTFKEKLVAENIVGSTLVGIKDIIDRIRVVPDPVLDRELKEKVLEELHRDSGLKGAKIAVEVKNGIVRLSGTVRAPGQALMADEAVSSLAGVIDLNNTLKVVPEKRSDQLITDQVFYYLDTSPIRTDQINFTVKNGVVHLIGKADHFDDIAKIVRDIQNMRGVAAVDTAIDVL